MLQAWMLLAAALLLVPRAIAADVVNLPPEGALDDATGTLTPTDVATWNSRLARDRPDRTMLWIRPPVTWVRYPVPASASAGLDQRWFLFTPFEFFPDVVDVYLQTPSGTQPVGRCGRTLPLETCPAMPIAQAYPFVMPANSQPATILIRMQATDPMPVSAYTLMTPASYTFAALASVSFLAFLFGSFMLVGVISLAAYVAFGDGRFAIIAGYFISQGMLLFVVRGNTLEAAAAICALTDMTFILCIGFIMVVFETWRTMPTWNRVLLVILVLSAASLIVDLVPALRSLPRAYAWVFIGPIVAIVTCWLAARRHLAFAKPFGLAFAALLVGQTLRLAWNQGYVALPWYMSFSALVGRLIGLVILAWIVLELIHDLRKRATLAEEAARESALLRAMMRILSHDLANSVMTAQLCVQRLQRTPDDSATTTRMTTKLDQVVGSQKALLDYARRLLMRRGASTVLATAPVSLTAAVAAARELLKERFADKKLELDVQAPEGDVLVLADQATLIHQILANLLDNAAKFSPPGRRIVVRITVTADTVRLDLENDGAPIPKDALQGSDSADAMGLGLPQAKIFVEAYGGRLEIPPRKDGATVTLFFRKPP